MRLNITLNLCTADNWRRLPNDADVIDAPIPNVGAVFIKIKWLLK